MHLCLFCDNKCSSHLYSLCSQHKCCCNSSSVSDSTCGNNRNIDCINDLWYKCHSRALSDMSARLAAFCNNCICSCPLHTFRKSHRSNNRNYFHSCFLPHFHIFSRTSGSSRHDLDTFFHNYFRNISRIRAHKHNIHSKWFVRQLACCPYLLAHPLCRSTGGTNKSKTTCF